MLKRILLFIVLLLMAAYLFLAITAFNRKPASQVCSDVTLHIKDSVYAGFVTSKEVTSILQKKGVDPIGKEMESIRTKILEETLSDHPLIDEVECFKTPTGKICVEVTQRIPVLRVMNDSGEDYYIDNNGLAMPSGVRCIAHLPIATGKIEKSFATRDLHKFALFLQHDSFWDAQIEQIHVLKGNKVELVPRVGDHIIYLGRLDNVENKLRRLKAFYKKALNKVGWNKYSRINVEFDNQIVCTKREL